MRHTTLCASLVCALALGTATAGAQQAGTGPSKPAAASTQAPINLNSASAAELESLPGIGPALAARIIEHRQKAGAFKKIEDLMNVRGIGEKQFLKLKPLISVGPAKPTERVRGQAGGHGGPSPAR